MLLRIVSQMAFGTHGFQVFGRTIGGVVVKVGNSQGAPVGIKRLAGLPALLVADFALPSCSVLYGTGYLILVFRVKLTLHRHGYCLHTHSTNFAGVVSAEQGAGNRGWHSPPRKIC